MLWMKVRYKKKIYFGRKDNFSTRLLGRKVLELKWGAWWWYKWPETLWSQNKEKSENLIQKVKLLFDISQHNNQACRYNSIRKWRKKDGWIFKNCHRKILYGSSHNKESWFFMGRCWLKVWIMIRKRGLVTSRDRQFIYRLRKKDK